VGIACARSEFVPVDVHSSLGNAVQGFTYVSGILDLRIVMD
jgi:hypothetical protein